MALPKTTEPLADSPASDAAASNAAVAVRRRLGIRGELALALLPTLTVLLVFGLVQAWSRQQLLFASLASSAFLIYLDPGHATNKARTLVVSQMLAALIGFCVFYLVGPGYLAAAISMVAAIVAMVTLDAVHPPAVSTALAFAFRANNDNNLLLFGLAVFLVVLLLGLQRASTWMLARATR